MESGNVGYIYIHTHTNNENGLNEAG